MSRLVDIVKIGYFFEFRKHKDEDGCFNGFSSPDQYADYMVDNMTNCELLECISNAIEECLE